MDLNTRTNQGIAVFDLGGRIIGGDSVELKKAIDEAIANAGDAPKLIFNLAELSMMDSSGLGTIIGAHVSVARKGGRIGVISVGAGIRNMLVMAKLITVLEHFDSEDQAVEGLKSS